MNAQRRIETYTRDRSTLTAHQRRRVIHKARGKERTAALALIAALAVSACSGGGSRPGEVTRVAAGPSSTTSTSTTTTQPPPPPSPAAVTRSEPSGRSRVPSPRPRSAPSTAPAPVQRGQSLGTFTATCYGAFEGYGGTTASGQQSGPGSIATDPRVIPMGTRLHVEGYGAGVANDVGGAVKGRKIDVWFRSAAECSAWGTRSVEVWAG